MNRARNSRRTASYLGAKLFELTLIAIWFGFAFVAVGDRSEARYLTLWDAVAAVYLTIGFLAVRRRGYNSSPLRKADMTRILRPLADPRFEFFTILAASLTGLTTALAVENAQTTALHVTGVLTILMAWTLLHAGYARFYASLTAADPAGPALEFPRSERLTSTDFFYFAFTIGTSFAVSDVSVTAPKMRWHVMVHSALSFFYNAAVLAIAIGVLTDRLASLLRERLSGLPDGSALAGVQVLLDAGDVTIPDPQVHGGMQFDRGAVRERAAQHVLLQDTVSDGRPPDDVVVQAGHGPVQALQDNQVVVHALLEQIVVMPDQRVRRVDLAQGPDVAGFQGGEEADHDVFAAAHAGASCSVVAAGAARNALITCS
ncbi:MAG: DUF1345 domain-containing protein [Streptosporangiaceae bacterium]